MAKRSLFEEVAADQPRLTPQGGMIAARTSGARSAIRLWLVALFLLVALMIMIGGLTRLSDAGLSITEWKPVAGALPPMDDASWAAEFGRYQAIPQYQLVNKGMTLDAFKTLYWWEWGHRQLGRVIGLVWFAGFLGFLLARKIPAGWTGRLVWIGVLGGLQGAIGWWMVSSGLQGALVSVASYRLAVHLGLAFVIFGFIGWYVLLLGRSEAALLQARRAREGRLAGWATALLVLAFVQVLLGALVAGIDAGRGFTDWPWMAGQLFPPEAFVIEPVWRNFLDNPGLVQFIHRISGYLLLLAGIAIWLLARRSVQSATRRAFSAVALMLLAQMVLGIFTVLYGAPLHLALTHQIGAILLWVLLLRARFQCLYPATQMIRRPA